MWILNVDNGYTRLGGKVICDFVEQMKNKGRSN